MKLPSLKQFNEGINIKENIVSLKKSPFVEWKAGETYEAEQKLVHNGKVYNVTTGFTAGESFDDTNMTVYIDGGGSYGVSGIEDWQAEHDYEENDICVNNGQIYRAKVGFISDTTFDTTEILQEYTPVDGETIIEYEKGAEVSVGDIVSYDENTYEALYDFICGEEFTKVAFVEYVPKSLTDSQIEDIVNSFNPEFIGTPYTNGVPIGTIINFMGTKVPSDYLICDGTIYNIVDYENLANFFLDQFGSYNYFGGDGTTTFAVPDLRGEFLRGTGTNSHTNQGSGANVGVHQDGTLDFTSKSSSNYIVAGSFGATDFKEDNTFDSGCKGYAITGSYTGGNVDVYTSRPTNTSVLYCIKYR